MKMQRANFAADRESLCYGIGNALARATQLRVRYPVPAFDVSVDCVPPLIADLDVPFAYFVRVTAYR